jgi:hypothetical protein
MSEVPVGYLQAGESEFVAPHANHLVSIVKHDYHLMTMSDPSLIDLTLYDCVTSTVEFGTKVKFPLQTNMVGEPPFCQLTGTLGSA